MKYLILTLIFLAACSEPPSTDPVTLDPLEEFYAIRTAPEWPAYKLAGTWHSIGGSYTLKDSLWENHDDGSRTAYAIDCRSDGRDIWIATDGKQHVLLGALLSSGIIARMIIEGANGRPGPIQSVTFQRAQ